MVSVVDSSVIDHVFVIFFLELSLIIRFVFVFVIFFLELSIYNDVS